MGGGYGGDNWEGESEFFSDDDFPVINVVSGEKRKSLEAEEEEEEEEEETLAPKKSRKVKRAVWDDDEEEPPFPLCDDFDGLDLGEEEEEEEGKVKGKKKGVIVVDLTQDSPVTPRVCGKENGKSANLLTPISGFDFLFLFFLFFIFLFFIFLFFIFFIFYLIISYHSNKHHLKTLKKQNKQTKKTAKTTPRKQLYQTNQNSPAYYFSSLFPCDAFSRDTNKLFLRHKKEITKCLFQDFNRRVFDNRLPSDMPIKWSKTLRKTAGYFMPSKNSIDLSDKVLDSYPKLRDTLIHEMCHAAVHNIDKAYKAAPHGREFKAWGRKAGRVYSNLKVTIYHSYDIKFKYIYACVLCGQTYKRHSKMIITGDRRRCCKCVPGGGQLKLLEEKGAFGKEKRALTGYQLFVKEHMAEVTKENPLLSKKEIMTLVASMYRAQKEREG